MLKFWIYILNFYYSDIYLEKLPVKRIDGRGIGANLVEGGVSIEDRRVEGDGNPNPRLNGSAEGI